MRRIDGKVAVITGGASGIGAATARLFVEEGARVLIADLQEGVAVDLAGQLGSSARSVGCNVAKEADVALAIGRAVEEWGRLDVLFNNAGFGGASGPLDETSVEDYDVTMDVLLKSVFLGIKHGLGLMREAGHGGSIINMSSVAGLKGSAFLAAYCATKGAVRLFTKAIALECGAAKDGVRVNSVHPGIIETPIWEGIVGMGEPGANAPPDLDAMSQLSVPLGVKGLPEDIANGVLWLASDESRYVTGMEMVIDGGLSIR